MRFLKRVALVAPLLILAPIVVSLPSPMAGDADDQRVFTVLGVNETR